MDKDQKYLQTMNINALYGNKELTGFDAWSQTHVQEGCWNEQPGDIGPMYTPICQIDFRSRRKEVWLV